MTSPDPTETLRRAAQFDEWLREGGNGDVADVLRDLVACVTALQRQIEDNPQFQAASDINARLAFEHGERAASAESEVARLREERDDANQRAHDKGC